MNGGAETLLCVRLWNVVVGMFGMAVYFFGMGRIVYPHEDLLSEEETGSGYLSADPTN
jgi:hypothetical protein